MKHLRFYQTIMNHELFMFRDPTRELDWVRESVRNRARESHRECHREPERATETHRDSFWLSLTLSDSLWVSLILSSLRDAAHFQIGWIFGKVPKGGRGGHFQSKNLYCKIWTFKQCFFSMKMIQRGLFRVCFYPITMLNCCTTCTSWEIGSYNTQQSRQMNIRTFVTILSRNPQYDFPKMRGGVKGCLKFFRKFIRFCMVILPKRQRKREDYVQCKDTSALFSLLIPSPTSGKGQ